MLTNENKYYFKIGEMAEMFDITIKTLRLYEKLGLFLPEYIDKKNGYRYYTADQVNRLNTILCLKGVGFTLQEIHHMSERKIDNEELSRLLQLKRAETQKKIDALQYNIEAINSMIDAAEGDSAKDRLSDAEKADVMSKISCLDSVKFDNMLTSIFWL